jgi:hypothetical protein
MKRMIRDAAILTTICLLSTQGHARSSLPGDDATLARKSETSELRLIRQQQDRQVAPRRGYVLDGDKDGTVSRAEANAHYSWVFTILDVDSDGRVRRTEFIDALDLGQRDPIRREAHLERLGTLFARLDTDGDHQVHRTEFLGACNAHFTTSDADGDGRVSVREFRSKRPL